MFLCSVLMVTDTRVQAYLKERLCGVVALPADKVQNWVGGVVNVDAATNLLSQGGIPQRQLGYGGAIEEVELEHVWVEAYVDGEWVALDPSFKQYEFTQGMDLEEAVPMEADRLVADIEAGALMDEEAGWIQGVDVAQMQNALDDYNDQLESYVTAHAPDATLGDVIGRKSVVPSEVSNIDALEFPYSRITMSEHTDSLPASLHYRFKLQVGSTTGGSFGMPIQWGSAIAELDEATVGLVGRSMAINFRPATISDEQTLLSYIPDDIENLEDLPASIPANTIHMIGEVTLDGEIVAETGEVTLGQTLMTRLGYIKPQSGWSYSENNLDVGGYSILDPDHGVGAYKISGGFSGGSLKTLWDYFMYWTNADGFPKWLKKGLGKLNYAFSFISNLKKIFNTEGCGAVDALGGAFLSWVAGSMLTKASLGLFFGVTGLFGLVIICLMVVLISMIISYLTSLLVSGVIASCKKKG